MKNISILHLFILISILYPHISQGTPVRNKESKKGYLDLRHWDFASDGPAHLDADWEFYWQQLLEPSDFENEAPEPDLFAKVPDKWSNYKIGGRSLPINGHATFRLRVLLANSGEKLQIKPLWPFLPTTCFVNGKQVGFNGKTGTAAAETEHGCRLHYGSFEATADTLDIIMQTANFEYEKGGLCFGVILDRDAHINKQAKKDSFFTLLFIGCSLFMSAYHFILFFLWKKDKAPLFLAFMLLGFATNYTLIDPFINELFSMELNLKNILYASIIPSIFLYAGFFSFVHCLYPQELKRKGLIILLIASTWNYLFIVISPAASQMDQYFRVIQILSLIYSLYTVILAAIRRRENAVVFLSGVAVLIIAGVLDIMTQLNIIHLDSLLLPGFMAFFFIQAFIVARRFSKAFLKNEKLNTRLSYINKNLEEIVSQRTATINEQKEHLDILNKTKDRIFTIIGHDLRSPLNSLTGISSVVKMLISKGNTERLLKISEQIEHSTHQMNILLDNLLKWAFIQTKQINFNPQQTDLSHIIQSTVDLLSHTADKKSISLNAEIKKGIMLSIDPNLITTVIRNLTSNAIKFTPQGGSVTINCSESPNGVDITITDTGVGIEKSKQESLFSLETGKSTNGTNNEKGTGIGLMLCKEFIELHNGSIDFESNEGKGSTFIIKLPRFTHEGSSVSKEDITYIGTSKIL